MSKQALLSAEISKSRALLTGGSSAQEVVRGLRQWVLGAPKRGGAKPGPAVLRWSESLCAAIRDALPLGSPVGRLLREVQPMVRREERLWSRLKALERQFGFQGAIAVVLPWAVASLSGGAQYNFFTVAGAFFQVLGLGVFYLLVQLTTRRRTDERAYMFEFLIATWMRVLAGMGLHGALAASLESLEQSAFRRAWLAWLGAFESGATALEEFRWSKDFEASPGIATLLQALLRSGAPAGEALADCIEQLEDQRLAELEERMAALPTRLSLCFCALLTPAVFLILMGALWPSLSALSI